MAFYAQQLAGIVYSLRRRTAKTHFPYKMAAAATP